MDDPIPVAAIRNELDKILDSRTFRLAGAQKAFLRYSVTEALAGRAALLKEYAIAVEAFKRGDDFDPRLDPIVRTQARKLRANLARYYDTDGEADSIRIEFPKGSYAPRFTQKQIAEPPLVPLVPEHATSGHSAPDRDRNPRRWLPRFGAASLVVAGLAACSLFLLWPKEVGRRDLKYVAILPLVSAGSDEDAAAVSDGFTHELIELLRQRPGLGVLPVGAPAARNGLKLGAVLVGSMRKYANRLRVTMQLNDPTNRYHLWTGSFDHDISQTRTVEWEIATAVGDVLSGDAVPTQRKLAANFLNLRSPNGSAYRSYLKGLHYWYKFTSEDLGKAQNYFEEAIAEDPSFAQAHVALADSYVSAPQVASVPPQAVVSKIETAASRALALDPSLGEAHIDLAIRAEYDFDWRRAETEFKKGLALNPGNVVGRLWYAKFLAILGRKEEVFEQRKRAAELDPVSCYAIQSVAGYFSVMGRYDEAISEFQNALAIDPTFGLAHQGLGVAYLLKGMPDRAIDELKLANRLMTGPRRMALLGYAYAVSGRTSESRQILDAFLEQARSKPFPALAIAQIYIGLRDRDRAFEWLEKAIDQHDLDVTLQWDSPYEPLRSDPRTLSLLKRMRLSS